MALLISKKFDTSFFGVILNLLNDRVFIMNKKIIPVAFSLLALLAIFFKLPDVSDLIGLIECSTCSHPSPYIPMLAAAYFAALIATILCFDTIPSPPMRYAGLVWAIGLAIVLTYLQGSLCYVCLIAHGCHILVWCFWRPSCPKPENMVGVKLVVVFSAFIAAMALFSTLHITLLAYGLKKKHFMVSSEEQGIVMGPEAVKILKQQILYPKKISDYKGIILNFVSADCPYCRQQMPQLNKIAQSYQSRGFAFFNFCSECNEEVQALGPNLNWVDNSLFEDLLNIQRVPTLVFLDSSGRIVQVLYGVPSNFEQQLQQLLNKYNSN